MFGKVYRNNKANLKELNIWMNSWLIMQILDY